MLIANDFVVIIPARLASTRLPEKILADIGGKPMIVRTAEAAMKSRASRVIVAADNEQIINACQIHGIEAVLTDTAHQSGTDRLSQAVEILGLPENIAVINVQGDEPLIEAEIINQIADFFIYKKTPMATVAHPIIQLSDFHNPNIVKTVLDNEDCALYFSRAPIPYPRDTNAHTLPEKMPVLRHVGIYAYSVPFLKIYHTLSPSLLEQTESLEQLRVLWHGFKIGVLVYPNTPQAGVDTAEDLARVREIWQQQYAALTV